MRVYILTDSASYRDERDENGDQNDEKRGEYAGIGYHPARADEHDHGEDVEQRGREDAPRAEEQPLVAEKEAGVEPRHSLACVAFDTRRRCCCCIRVIQFHVDLLLLVEQLVALAHRRVVDDLRLRLCLRLISCTHSSRRCCC